MSLGHYVIRPGRAGGRAAILELWGPDSDIGSVWVLYRDICSDRGPVRLESLRLTQTPG